jgi:hypothetical protein
MGFLKDFNNIDLLALNIRDILKNYFSLTSYTNKQFEQMTNM